MADFTRTVMRDQVRELIIARIISGEYAGGSRIVESQIAHELGVSQAPVREALRDLSALRFVETEPYKGARVRTLALEELAEIYPVRAALEQMAASLTVTHSTPEALGEIVVRLSEDLHAMRTAAKKGDLKQLLVADAHFHRTVVESSANDTLVQLWSSLRIEASTLMSAIRTDDDLNDIVETHTPLLLALEAGDPEVAATAFRRHIEEFGERVSGMVAEVPRTPES